jgi:hypothetical protein
MSRAWVGLKRVFSIAGGGRFVITVCNEILFFKFSWNRLTDDVWMYAGTSILYIGEFSGGCYVSCLHRYIFQIR